VKTQEHLTTAATMYREMDNQGTSGALLTRTGHVHPFTKRRICLPEAVML
jgi:hypothetical protein